MEQSTWSSAVRAAVRATVHVAMLCSSCKVKRPTILSPFSYEKKRRGGTSDPSPPRPFVPMTRSGKSSDPMYGATSAGQWKPASHRKRAAPRVRAGGRRGLALSRRAR